MYVVVQCQINETPHSVILIDKQSTFLAADLHALNPSRRIVVLLASIGLWRWIKSSLSLLSNGRLAASFYDFIHSFIRYYIILDSYREWLMHVCIAYSVVIQGLDLVVALTTWSRSYAAVSVQMLLYE